MNQCEEIYLNGITSGMGYGYAANDHGTTSQMTHAVEKKSSSGLAFRGDISNVTTKSPHVSGMLPPEHLPRSFSRK